MVFTEKVKIKLQLRKIDKCVMLLTFETSLSFPIYCLLISKLCLLGVSDVFAWAYCMWKGLQFNMENCNQKRINTHGVAISGKQVDR
jgi:hypothetical protein